ncbi:MAG: enoyl-CoA hydratase/isomerase family protein [Robiginitomaculum sp.]|nr:enoyl-CoA hydratase/isomerase family protein [Robiginitomaculum sp.]
MEDYSSHDTLNFALSQQVGVLTFNRPEVRNSINEAMIHELDKVLSRIEFDKKLRALILTGAGNTFVAGGDISMINKGLKRPYEFFRLHDILTGIGTRLERLNIPTIAAINGAAFGGGLELALACDIRIMSQTATIALPEAGLGIIPGAGGTARLARIIGKEQSLLMKMTGDKMNADEALRLGLVSKITKADKTLEAAHELARKICTKAPLAIAAIKRSVTISENMSLEGAIDYCQHAALLLGTTQDAREGMRAFLEKRTPIWKGE